MFNVQYKYHRHVGILHILIPLLLSRRYRRNRRIIFQIVTTKWLDIYVEYINRGFMKCL